MEPHELDAVSLTAGLLLLGIGIGHLAGLNVADLAVSGLWPMLLIIGGGILLVRVMRRARDG